MRTISIAGIALMLAAAPALAQVAGQPSLPPKPQPAKHAAPAKPPQPAQAASTPEMRSAAELALSSDPVFDDGTYLRIKETLLSYSDIQVRGGWPALPANANLAPGASGPDVALLAPASRHRRRHGRRGGERRRL